MSIIIDLIVVGIIAVNVFITMKKGFMKTALSLISLILAFVIVASVARPASEWIYDTFIEKSVCSTIKNSEEKAEEKGTEVLWNALPEFVTSSAEKVGFNEQKLNEIIDRGETKEETYLRISQEVVKPVAVPVIMVIVEILLFSVLMIVFAIISKLICKVFKAPGLKEANKFLGGVLGFAKGIIIAVIVCYILSLLSSALPQGKLWIFSEESIKSSYIYGTIIELINPAK